MLHHGYRRATKSHISKSSVEQVFCRAPPIPNIGVRDDTSRQSLARSSLLAIPANAVNPTPSEPHVSGNARTPPIPRTKTKKAAGRVTHAACRPTTVSAPPGGSPSPCRQPSHRFQNEPLGKKEETKRRKKKGKIKNQACDMYTVRSGTLC